MTPSPDPKPLQYSALQLAWLRELGVDKPWLPGDTRAVSAPVRGTEGLGAAAPAPAPAPTATATATATATPVRASPRGVASKHQQAAAPVSAIAITAMTALTTAAAGAATDLQALTLVASACQACGLCREREQIVMGQGVTQPAVMVVGEGPGEQEDRKGLPFLTESGALLDQMLAAIGRARTRDVYLANLVKCRPPGNRRPQPEELAACKPYLLRQFELVRPFSILALGRDVAQSLLNTDEPLQNLRGRVHHLEVGGQRIALVASYHTGHLLNHPADKAAAWQDLQLLRSLR